MLERLPRGKRNAALALLGLLTVFFVWSLREVFNPLFLAYILAWIVHPLVLRLEGKGWSRMKAVNVIYVVTILAVLVAGLGFWVQGSALATRVVSRDNNLLHRVDDTFEDWKQANQDSWWMQMLTSEEGPEEGPVEDEGGDSGDQTPPTEAAPAEDTGEPEEAEDGEAPSGAAGSAQPRDDFHDDGYAIVEFLSGLTEKVGEEEQKGAILSAGGAVTHWFGSIIGFFSMLVLLPIYTWYLLFELERIHAGIRRYIPKRERERVSRIARQIGDVLTAFFRGRLVVCALKGVFLTVGLLAMGVPYAVFLGMVSGFASLIPFVGAFLGFAFSYLVSLVAPGADPVLCLVLVSVVFGIAEVIEGYVLVPKILGDTLGMHPLFVFVAIFIGGATLGMFGFLIALPLAASGKILVQELVVPALQQFAEEDVVDASADTDAGAAPEGAAPAPDGSSPGPESAS